MLPCLKSLLSFTVLFLCATLASEANSCEPVSLEQFHAQILTLKRPLTLAFFSTWCADCKTELEKINQSSDKGKFILISEFDSLERVNRNLTALKIEARCYFDKEGKIKDEFGVKVVPTEKELK